MILGESFRLCFRRRSKRERARSGPSDRRGVGGDPDGDERAVYSAEGNSLIIV